MEMWLNHGNWSNQTKVSHFLHEARFVSACMQIACTQLFTAELMDVSGFWSLTEKKLKELLHLLFFVWSPGSEEWPSLKKTAKKIFFVLECSPGCTSWICKALYMFA